MLEYHWIFTEMRTFSIVDPTASTSEALQWHWKKKLLIKPVLKVQVYKFQIMIEACCEDMIIIHIAFTH